MTTKTPQPRTALALLSLLEDHRAAGRIEHDAFEELAADVDSLVGDGDRLARARSNVMSWEATVLEQAERMATGAVSEFTLRNSGVCLRHSLSELGRLEEEHRELTRRLWDALVRAAATPNDSTNEEESRHEA